MKLLLLIGPLDKLLADKGLAWLTSAGNIALAFLIAHVAVKAVGKVAKTIANGRFKKVQDQPYFTHSRYGGIPCGQHKPLCVLFLSP